MVATENKVPLRCQSSLGRTRLNPSDQFVEGLFWTSKCGIAKSKLIDGLGSVLEISWNGREQRNDAVVVPEYEEALCVMIL